MNLSKIQRDIFMKNAMLRGEAVKKRKTRTTKKKVGGVTIGGVTIGGKKRKTATKKKVGGKKQLPPAAQNWLNLVKQVYASGNMSWKDALKSASKIYRKM